jgi:MYXO-CTERM domain-containing protein
LAFARWVWSCGGVGGGSKVDAALTRALLFLTLLAALLYAGAARANGAFPDSQSIMTPDSKPHSIRLATNFGVISTDDDGGTWLWSCEQPETNNGSLYQMGPAPKSRLYVISSEGLAFSDNDSCGWSIAKGSATGMTVSDAFPDPTNPNRVLAVAASVVDGGASYEILESSDAGSTFGPVRYTAAAGDNVTGVEIARAAPQTIYVAMTSGPTFLPKLAHSTNGGTSWQVEDLSAKLPTKTSLIRIVAVDPQDANRVYLRTHSPAGDAFAVAVAGANGFTVTTPLTFPGGILSAYARLASGTIVLAAVVGVDQVAYKSTDSGATFQTLPGTPSVRAMSARGSTLYVVADNEVDGYAIGTSTDEGQTWQPLMRYDQIAAIQACVHAACQTDCMSRAAAGQWDDQFCAATAPAIDAGTPPTDAGTPPSDAGPTGSGGSGGADAGLVPPDNAGCGCGVGDGGTWAALPLIFAVAIAALRRRARRL